MPPAPIHPTFEFESSPDILVVRHTGGDIVPKAFEGSGSDLGWTDLKWRDLEVRVNGVLVGQGKIAVHNDELLWSGEKDFGLGDVLKIKLDSSLTHEDSVTLIYKPTKQTLADVRGREIRARAAG